MFKKSSMERIKYFPKRVYPIDTTDTICVKNVYLRVITEPYYTGCNDETAVRLSDELGLFSRYYQNQLNTDTMADFVRSLRDNAIKLPPSMYGEAYRECRSRYIQSPSELSAYIQSLDGEATSILEDGRLRYAKELENQRLRQREELVEQSKSKVESTKSD